MQRCLFCEKEYERLSNEHVAYSGVWRSRVRSHPDQQSEVKPITVPD